MQTPRFTLLYVDDEKNNLIVFKSTFYKQYKVITASSAPEGLQLMEQNEVDLVISDHRMPEMSGIEFLEKIYHQYPEVPRLVITAYVDVELVIDAINRCGIYQYILKPWDPRELKLTISNALQKFELQKQNNSLIAELKRSNETLEQKIKERTLALEKTNHDLREANESKNKLLSIISHDLMTPLVSLGILLEVITKMQNKITAEKLHQYSIKIKGYLANVTEMLENLLSWSVSQLGQGKTINHSISANDLLIKNYELYKIAADRKQINFHLKKTNENLIVAGDENMINVVLRNLISNAIKFTHEEGTIKINLEKVGDKALFEIEDDGMGILPEHLPRLFDKNFHKSTNGTHQEKGTGIGLKLCKEFVDKMNGNIWVKSEPEKGATFSFSIPLIS